MKCEEKIKEKKKKGKEQTKWDKSQEEKNKRRRKRRERIRGKIRRRKRRRREAIELIPNSGLLWGSGNAEPAYLLPDVRQREPQRQDDWDDEEVGEALAVGLGPGQAERLVLLLLLVRL